MALIRVMTYNIHHGQGTDGRLDLNRIADVLIRSEADVIGLNEVDRRFSRRSDYIDQAAWLADHLQMHLAFGATANRKMGWGMPPGCYGNALLSRFPIVSETNHPLDVYVGIIEGRSLLECTLLVGDQPLKTFVTHLSPNPHLRKKQVNGITRKIALEPDCQPVVMMGDFNMRPGGKRWVQLHSHLEDVFHAPGMTDGHTFPSYRPLLQLDYIFASRNIRIQSAEVVAGVELASDHLPVRASIML